jgi:uncharacterized protein (DUF4415 family)
MAIQFRSEKAIIAKPTPAARQDQRERAEKALQSEVELENTVRGKRKVSVTIRLPEEVVDFFKSEGTLWQTRVCRVLEAYVVAQKSPPISKEAGDVDGPAPDA